MTEPTAHQRLTRAGLSASFADLVLERRDREVAQQAEVAVGRVRDLHAPASDWSWKPLGCQHDGEHSAPCRHCVGQCWPCPTIAALDRPAHDGGPTVQEATNDDRAHWTSKHAGEGP